MILYHTTSRDACASIAEQGLRDGVDGIVYLSPEVWSWRRNGTRPIELIHRVARHEVVLLFDVPDAVANGYLAEDEVIGPGHPEYDPEIDDPDEPGVPVELDWREYRIPAAVLNRHFAGVAFWHGECPLTGGQLRLMWERRAALREGDWLADIPEGE